MLEFGGTGGPPEEVPDVKDEADQITWKQFQVCIAKSAILRHSFDIAIDI